MLNFSRVTYRFFVGLAVLLVLSLACRTAALQTPTPPVRSPRVILHRLGIAYLGLDGQKVIGSGCPGSDGLGSIENYHFIVSGVEPAKHVARIVLTGDNSTLTWAWPCSDNWALLANDMGNGNWEIFIAPSLPTRVYTVLFFYDDDSVALG